MDSSIEQLAQDLAFAAYSPRTREAYVGLAKVLATFCGKPLVDATREELRSFVAERAARGKSTLRVEMCALRFLFCRTLGKPELVSFIKLPRKHSRLPEVLSLEEVNALLRSIRERCYQAIAMVMYGAGLRISEAIALEVGDIDGRRGVIHVRNTKTKRDREAKLSQALYEWLRRYWAQVRPPEPYLFWSRKTGKRLRVSTVRKALALAAKEAGIKKPVRPHILRHSFATHLLDEGYDVHVVRELLGHASIDSTVRYARVTRKRIRETPSPLELLPQRP